MKDTFCPIPWNFQAVRSNGDLRICCQANISKDQGILRKEDGSVFNAEVDNLEQARNSSLIKNVRSKMLQGNWSPTCVRCKQEENAGLNSRRIYERERWTLSLNDVEKITEKDGTIDLNESAVVFYDLRFGNLCNLKCRMCGPTDSSAWYEDWVKLTGRKEFKDTCGQVQLEESGQRFKTSAYDWHYGENFWAQFEESLKNIKHIYMAGGEPLLIKRHYDFLETCVERGYARSIGLEYNTNCTQLPGKVLELWTHFKYVHVGASIDGFGQVLEYQRYPAQWNKIYANLKLLNSLPKNVLSWLAFTVSAYNVFHMVDFMKWKLTNTELANINRTKRRPIITPHMAHHPQHLNIRVLPDQLKAKLVKEFREFLLWVKAEDFSEDVEKQAIDIVESVTSYMNAESYHADYWDEFCNFTMKLDRIRNQDVREICPEFVGYLNE